MRVVPTALPDVLLVEPVVHRDPRGFLLETYHAEQVPRRRHRARRSCRTTTRARQRGTLRGLHAQLGARRRASWCASLRGEIFDVAVDVRRGSPTFGRWVGARLSDENFRQLWVPPGFLHGFCVLGECADVAYKCTELWNPADEITVRWDDPEIGIVWPTQDPLSRPRMPPRRCLRICSIGCHEARVSRALPRMIRAQRYFASAFFGLGRVGPAFDAEADAGVVAAVVVLHDAIAVDQHEGRRAAHAVVLERGAVRIDGDGGGERLLELIEERGERVGVLVGDRDDLDAALLREGHHLGQRGLARHAPGRPEEQQARHDRRRSAASPRNGSSLSGGAALPTLGGPGSSGIFERIGLRVQRDLAWSARRAATSSGAGSPISRRIVHSRTCCGSLNGASGGPRMTSPTSMPALAAAEPG